MRRRLGGARAAPERASSARRHVPSDWRSSCGAPPSSPPSPRGGSALAAAAFAAAAIAAADAANWQLAREGCARRYFAVVRRGHPRRPRHRPCGPREVLADLLEAHDHRRAAARALPALAHVRAQPARQRRDRGRVAQRAPPQPARHARATAAERRVEGAREEQRLEAAAAAVVCCRAE